MFLFNLMLSDLTVISHLTSQRPVLTTTVFPVKPPPFEEGNNPVACNVEEKKAPSRIGIANKFSAKTENYSLKL